MWCSHQKWWFSIVMLVYQRVPEKDHVLCKKNVKIWMCCLWFHSFFLRIEFSLAIWELAHIDTFFLPKISCWNRWIIIWGFPKWGYPKLSSIYKWDFPWNQPGNQLLGIPHDLETLHMSSQTDADCRLRQIAGAPSRRIDPADSGKNRDVFGVCGCCQITCLW